MSPPHYKAIIISSINKMKNLVIIIISGISYISMVFINYLANALPINNRNTWAISNSYPNLFTPAWYTFSIWGLIYLMLLAYLIYQFICLKKKRPKMLEDIQNKINILFTASSIANISWIFAWHYDFIWLSVIIMIILLALLINITDQIRSLKITTQEKLFISTPFSIYFWWITVAAIANITVYLVSIGWNGFWIQDYIWTIVILLAWTMIGILRMHKDKNIAYGMVLIWAYIGILIKHVSGAGFDWKYPSIIITLIICLLLYVFYIVKMYFKKIA
ncbi:MAG: hypothetical protein ACD_2C00103G0001 [uncultured bacterium (gcode 4)]|uniref:Tryptophan-rich sensory protein n=1 Tax=uncultured bacterium (gcode 4) TaxID=1234023 RepID=K2GH62_9BACT|nr:MAG: hypothetical protein ACD_2C00103G0001 [uncultured bacterium (gcode 4)]